LTSRDRIVTAFKRRRFVQYIRKMQHKYNLTPSRIRQKCIWLRYR